MREKMKKRLVAFLLAGVLLVSQMTGSMRNVFATEESSSITETLENGETSISDLTADEYKELVHRAKYQYGKFVKYHDDSERKYHDCDWYRSASLRGIYSAKEVRDCVGKEYLGETVYEILQMANDKKYLPEFDLGKFFKGNVLSALELEDLVQMQRDGRTLDEYILSSSGKKQMRLMAARATQTGTLKLRSTQYKGSYSIQYEDRKGNDRTLSHNGSVFQMSITTGGKKYPAFCISLGKSASSGTTYHSTDADGVGMGKNGILALKRAAFYYENVKKQTDRVWVLAQVYVWACANAGADPDDSSIIYAVSRQLGKSAEDSKKYQKYFEDNVIAAVPDENYTGVELTYWKTDTASNQNFATYFMSNIPETGTLYLSKQDNGIDFIPGVRFNIYSDKDCKNKVTDMTTNANGDAYSPDLDVGTYYVKEVASTVPDGLAADTKAYKIDVKADEQSTVESEKDTGSFLNEGYKATLETTKKDLKSQKELKGVEFRLYEYSNNHKKYLESGYLYEETNGVYRYEDAEYTIDNQGKFYVSETIPRNGYFGDYNGDDGYQATGEVKKYYFDLTKDKNGKTFVLTNHGFVEKEKTTASDNHFNNTAQTGELVVEKIDSEAGKYVSSHGDACLNGAVYGLYAEQDIVHPDGVSGVVHRAGDLVQTGVIMDGQFTMKELLLGSYTLREINEPVGYQRDSNSYPVTLTTDSDRVKVVLKRQTVSDEVDKQAFQLIKMSADGKKSEADIVENAGFRVYLIRDLIAFAKEKGIDYTFSREEDGNYAGSRLKEFFDKAKEAGYDYASLPAAKTYKEAGEAFTEGDTKWLEALGDNQYQVKEMFSDNKGYVLSPELPYGEYVCVESTVPENLTEIVPFIVHVKDESSEPMKWRIFNDISFEAYLKVVKRDKVTGKTVLKAGTKYQIYTIGKDNEGNETETLLKQTYSDGKDLKTVDTFETDEEGTIMTVKPLSSGRFRIYEVEACEGYYNAGEHLDIEISDKAAYEAEEANGGTYNIILHDYDNDEVKGLINVEKTGEMLVSYDKTEQKVVDDYAKELFGLSEDKAFTYEERKLPGATYEIRAKEDIVTQDNQVDDKGNRTIFAKKGEVLAEITTGKDGKLGTLDKSLFAGTDYESMIQLRYDENGECLGVTLPLGSYSVIEKAAPYGFALDTEEKEIIFTWKDDKKEFVSNSSEGTKSENGVLTLRDNRVRADVRAIKQDIQTKKNVQGALFGLFTKTPIYNVNGERLCDGDTLLATAVTDEDGSGAFPLEIPYQSQGYGETPSVEQVTSGGAVSVDSAATETKNSGAYYVKEIRAADGYYPDDRNHDLLFVPGENKKTVLQELISTHFDMGTQISVVKQGLVRNKDGKEKKTNLKGAVLQIIDVDTKAVVREWTTTEEILDVTYLTLNKEYILHEKAAPAGYVTAKDIRFKLVDTTDYTQTPEKRDTPYDHRLTLFFYNEKTKQYTDGQISTVTMVDDYTKVQISKKDVKTKKNLSGAKLRLMQGNKVVKEWSSGKKAETIYNLPVGEYTLKEIAVPKGYKKAKDMKISVKDTGKKQAFTMYDGKSAGDKDDGGPSRKPQTGDSIRIVLYLAAVLFLGGAFGFVWYTDPKRKAKRAAKKAAMQEK